MVSTRISMAVVLSFLGLLIVNEVRCVVILYSAVNEKAAMRIHNDGKTQLNVKGPGVDLTTVSPGNDQTFNFAGVGQVYVEENKQYLINTNLGSGSKVAIYISPSYGFVVLTFGSISLTQTAETLALSVAGEGKPMLAISQNPGTSQSLSVSPTNIALSQGPEPRSLSFAINTSASQTTAITKQDGIWSIVQTY